MKEQLELNQLIYSIIKTQIEFGTYRFEEHLPPIEEMADILVVSVDTIRLAYRRLQTDGYITLSKRIGSVVTVQYDDKEVEQNIQTYFAERADSLLDICRSIPLLLRGIQVSTWKSIPLEELDKIELDALQTKPAFWVLFYIQTLYRTLNNDLLMNFFLWLNTFYTLPFLSLTDYEKYVDRDICAIPDIIKFRREENWTALQVISKNVLEKHQSNISSFYKTRISVPPSKNQITFTWSCYKRASQICYSVGMDILTSIAREYYPVGSFLPSQKKLAKEKHVSVSTIRQTLSLLNNLGIVKTINGVGTQVLSMDQIADNCNLANPIVRKRLLDCKQSLQLFALSCRDVASSTISSMDESSLTIWMEQLILFEQLDKLALIVPFSLKFMSQSAPYQTIRTFYSELYKQLFWGVPLRGMMGTQEVINDIYRPYHQSMLNYLKSSDAEGFAAILEEASNLAVQFVSERLAKYGIQETDSKSITKYGKNSI